VWIGGNGPLDVEGFRSPASPVMNAYQYFWRNGHIIGRGRAAALGFDTRHGHNHWHFEQFARYALLGADRELAVRSHKQGFCLGPDDPVDLLAPHAVWQPPPTGLTSQWCGMRTALWVREMLPVGWGDTYFNSVAGQSFDITGVPNGTYYIEVIANPLHVLHETRTGNDISLRKVILSGSRATGRSTCPPGTASTPNHADLVGRGVRGLRRRAPAGSRAGLSRPGAYLPGLCLHNLGGLGSLPEGYVIRHGAPLCDRAAAPVATWWVRCCRVARRASFGKSGSGSRHLGLPGR